MSGPAQQVVVSGTKAGGNRQGGVRQNAVGRAIASLSIGAVRDVQKREARRKNMGLGEFELQFQVPISGEAGTSPAFDQIGFDFETPFYYAPFNRDSDLDRPQVAFGPVIENGSPVVITACVTGWDIDPETDGVVGATVSVGAFMPDTTVVVPFGGYLHVTFQGYGGVVEDETDV